MTTHTSILAWKIPWTEETGRPQFIGLHRVGHGLSDLASRAQNVLMLVDKATDLFIA